MLYHTPHFTANLDRERVYSYNKNYLRGYSYQMRKQSEQKRIQTIEQEPRITYSLTHNLNEMESSYIEPHNDSEDNT